MPPTDTPTMELRQNSILRISDEKTMELVELYEKEQCLWNTTLEEYKSRSRRRQAAERIAKKLNIKHFTSRYVIIKFKNLRNSYCQELKKTAHSKAIGENPPHRPKVFWFKKMDSFLRPHLHQASRDATVVPSSITHELIIKSEPAESEELVQLTNPEDVFVEENNYSDSDEDDDQPLQKRSRNSSTTSKRLRIDDSYYNSEQTRLMKEVSAQLHVIANQKDDCYDSFGKYVASMLRSMPIQKAMEMQPQIVHLLVSGNSVKCETVPTNTSNDESIGISNK